MADSAIHSDTQQQTPAAAPRRRVGRLRTEIPRWQSLLFGFLSIACMFLIWWILTRGEQYEDRIVSPVKLPSIAETFGSFKSLGFEKLADNAYVSLRRVILGFGLAALVGVPLGVLAGCFSRFAALLAPVTIFGRNIPMAALIPLSFLLFGIDEFQKIMFIFIAAVAFIVFDSAQAIRDVPSRYIDTAYTLGARRWQVIIKVLVPLAMPSIFNSLRLLFGLAFGYIMLAEVIQIGGVAGLGGIINNSFRRGPRELVYLILLIIPLIALVIDRFLYWVQYELFPYRYGSNGGLARLFRGLMRAWESATDWLWRPALVHAEAPAAGSVRPADAAPPQSGDRPAAATDVPKPKPSQTPDSSSEQ
jgi:ABC-type nitrate/sulfonate/bicarbonate transport system permease component